MSRERCYYTSARLWFTASPLKRCLYPFSVLGMIRLSARAALLAALILGGAVSNGSDDPAYRDADNGDIPNDYKCPPNSGETQSIFKCTPVWDKFKDAASFNYFYGIVPTPYIFFFIKVVLNDVLSFLSQLVSDKQHGPQSFLDVAMAAGNIMTAFSEWICLFRVAYIPGISTWERYNRYVAMIAQTGTVLTIPDQTFSAVTQRWHEDDEGHGQRSTREARPRTELDEPLLETYNDPTILEPILKGVWYIVLVVPALVPYLTHGIPMLFYYIWAVLIPPIAVAAMACIFVLGQDYAEWKRRQAQGWHDWSGGFLGGGAMQYWEQSVRNNEECLHTVVPYCARLAFRAFLALVFSSTLSYGVLRYGGTPYWQVPLTEFQSRGWSTFLSSMLSKKYEQVEVYANEVDSLTGWHTAREWSRITATLQSVLLPS